MTVAAPAVTILFTDIEGSTRLWEQQAERMRPALDAHDRLTKAAVAQHDGTYVKSTGDGHHAVFDDPLQALRAVLQIQRALGEISAEHGVTLKLRCGMHLGADQRRDGDFFGPAVNRAARVMNAAHGGQTLLSQAVADRLAGRLPESASLRDLGRVRLRDLSSPERVYQLLHPWLRADFPPLRSLEATPNNLAQQLNSFIGREREMGEVRTLLAAHRLVMLLGLGGIGKSRLSVQLGAELIGDFADGVWLIELAPLTDPRLVPQALASVLGVKEETGRPVMEALLKHVAERQLLVILDNCEHVVAACADLTKQLLQAAPQLKVLASSREVLRIAGETVYQMPTLSAPEPAPGRVIALDTLAGHDAVRLFVDRTTAAQPAFALNERNAAAVAEICHRLDGIPLAIELAAARARSMPVETLAARLVDRFRLLKTSDQTVLPRQRTLRALIDWSYDLLDPAERAVFQRLSVFAGGWTLEAAEAVCAGDEVDEMHVLDLLSQLVEKSLVVLDAEGARYRMLETVRQYGQEHLAHAGDAADVRDRHLAHYLAQAEAAQPRLVGADQAEWLLKVDAERENLLGAHVWCDTTADGALLGQRLVDNMSNYLLCRGLHTLGMRMTLEVLARPGLGPHREARGRALFDAGQYCDLLGEYTRALGFEQEALSLARETDSVRLSGSILTLLGRACQALGKSTEARHYLEEALAVMRSLGSQHHVAVAANHLAQLYRSEGKLDAAEPLYQDALSGFREAGDGHQIAAALLNLSMVEINRGSYASARRMLGEALDIAERIMPTPALQWVMDVCAGLASTCGDWPDAARFTGFCEAQSEVNGHHRDSADEVFLLPLIAKARAALGELAFERHSNDGRQFVALAAIQQARRYIGAAR